MNVFCEVDAGGRFLFEREPLHWGRHYWVLTESACAPPKEIEALIEWNPTGSLSGWYVYEVALPITFAPFDWSIQEKLSGFFGRHIAAPQPRAFLVHPFPHHVALDGAYILAVRPKTLIVRKTSECSVNVENATGSGGGGACTPLGENFVQIALFADLEDEIVLTANGVEQEVIRWQNCELLQPPGIRAYCAEVSWDLLSDVPLDEDTLYSEELRLECGNTRLAAHIGTMNKNWTVYENALTQGKNDNKSLIAGGFGAIPHAQRSSSKDNEAGRRLQAGPQPRVEWINGLIVARYGQPVSAAFLACVENPDQVRLQMLSRLISDALMIHVRAAIRLQS